MRIKVLLASLACALASFAAHAALVEIVPVGQNKTIGDDVIVDIVGSGFTTPTLGGGFSLTFSGGVLSLAGADGWRRFHPVEPLVTAANGAGGEFTMRSRRIWQPSPHVSASGCRGGSARSISLQGVRQPPSTERSQPGSMRWRASCLLALGGQ